MGGLDAGLRYALDYDLWIRMSERHAFARVPGTLATSRMHQSDGCTHRFRDGWMSKAYEARRDVPAGAGTLIVAGRHVAGVRRPLVLTVSVDGVRLGRAVVVEYGRFERRFDVPTDMRGRPRLIRVVSAWTWRPGGRRGDNRRLSCLLDGVALAA